MLVILFKDSEFKNVNFMLQLMSNINVCVQSLDFIQARQCASCDHIIVPIIMYCLRPVVETCKFLC